MGSSSTRSTDVFACHELRPARHLLPAGRFFHTTLLPSRILMRTRFLFGMIGVFLAGLLGCNRDKTAEQVGEMNKSNIQRVSNMYAAYQNMKSSGGPKDEADLKAWIKEYDPNKLSMMKIDANNLDGLFTSERDGKPFKVRYKVGGGRGSVSAVVFEQEGVERKEAGRLHRRPGR